LCIRSSVSCASNTDATKFCGAHFTSQSRPSHVLVTSVRRARAKFCGANTGVGAPGRAHSHTRSRARVHVCGCGLGGADFLSRPVPACVHAARAARVRRQRRRENRAMREDRLRRDRKALVGRGRGWRGKTWLAQCGCGCAASDPHGLILWQGAWEVRLRLVSVRPPHSPPPLCLPPQPREGRWARRTALGGPPCGDSLAAAPYLLPPELGVGGFQH
jgi:hypothetical protein